MRLFLMSFLIFGTICPIPANAVNRLESFESPIANLEAKLEQDPETVLKEARALVKRNGTYQKGLSDRAILLEGKALNQLKRYEESHAVLDPLLTRLTGNSDTEPLFLSRVALELGKSLSSLSRPFDAEILLQMSLRQIPEGVDAKHKGQILVTLSLCFLIMGEPVTAAETATNCIQWANEHGQKELALHARYLFAYACRNMKNLNLAKQYFQQTTEQSRKLKNTYYEIVSLNELSNIMILEEKYEAAILLKQDTLKRARETSSDHLVSICLHDLAFAISMSGDYKRALPMFKRCLSMDQSVGTAREIVVTKLNLADCYSRLGNIPKSIKLAQNALTLAKKNRLGEVEESALLQLIQSMETRGWFSRALSYQQELTELQKRRFQRELKRKVTELKDRHRLMDQETEIRFLKQGQAMQNLQISRQRFFIASVIAMAVLLALLAGIATRGNRLKQRANRKLAKLNQQLDELARTDVLTGLSNRRDMMDKLRLFTARTDRSGVPIAILMGDLDNFKAINDTYGHDTGDCVLQEAAHVLKGQVRSQDLLARWGGEEFLIALPDTSREDARVAAHKLRLAVENCGIPEKCAAERMTITIGLSVYTPDRELEAVIMEADDRLYEGKEAGRNRVMG